MNKFELVIFDCDGVLVDSERITNQVFAQMLNELGIPVTLNDMFERFVGRSMNQCLDLISELLGHAPPADFVENYRIRTKAALEAQLTPVPGIEAALDEIKLPCCVASSGDHDQMRTTLGITGLLPRFEGRLFSVTEVARGKPAADVFLYAASKCNARAQAMDTPPFVCLLSPEASSMRMVCALRAALMNCGPAEDDPCFLMLRANEQFYARLYAQLQD
jgi:beta-phosphoglucomutase-like phosphatase (HAD superfamily)